MVLLKKVFSQIAFWNILAFVAFNSNFINAQQSVNTSGGNATSTTGTVSYSVGQVFYNHHINSQGAVNQGVQNAYEVFSADIIESNSLTKIAVFPNPTSDLITVKILNYTGSINYRVELIDANGRLVKENYLQASISSLDLSQFPSSTYSLNILGNQSNKIATYKIIKN